ncbi:hypothetical protein B0H13DRAFT_1871625 [Mycena leptocephala]|nr:hypothetical protein B0H13DRAFT_1871625 [Mycena leptocephala]
MATPPSLQSTASSDSSRESFPSFSTSSLSDVPEPSLPQLDYTPSSSSFSLESSVRNPDASSVYANFKCRVWFTWYIMQMHTAHRPAEFWLAVVSGADANGDLWLWEEEDEEYIKAFIEDHSLISYLDMPLEDWSNAGQALRVRQNRPRPMRGPLSHLTSKTRLRFISWLIVAEVGQKNHLLQSGEIGSLGELVAWWGSSTVADYEEESCELCHGISDLLRVWLETVLEVYLLDDLWSIPWDAECNCFPRQLAAMADSGQSRTIQLYQRNSAAHHALFELIVPPWPFILWVVFRTVGNNGTEPLQTFLDILRGPDQDLFTWDNADNDFLLYRILVNYSQLGLYPQDWNRYMIRNMTRTVDRPRREPDDLLIRLAAVSLRFSSALIIPQSILAPLGMTFDSYPFSAIALVVDKNYKKQSTPNDLGFKELWADPDLGKWLLARSQDLCHAIWHTSSPMTTLERVQSIHLGLTVPTRLAHFLQLENDSPPE